MLEESGRRIGVSDVIPMFPTLVWKAELHTQLSEAINAKALAALSHMRRDRPPLAPSGRTRSIVVCDARAALRLERFGYTWARGKSIMATGTPCARGGERIDVSVSQSRGSACPPSPKRWETAANRK